MPVLETLKNLTKIETSDDRYGSLTIKGSLPYRLYPPKSKYGIAFDEDNPTLTFKCTGNKTISLTKTGFVENKKVSAYTKASLESFSKKLINDTALQRSVLEVSKALWALPALHYGQQKIEIFNRESSEQYSALLSSQAHAYSNIFKGNKKAKCELKTVAETISTSITEWVDVVTTAAEQAKNCIDSCDENYWPIDPRRATCYLGCAANGFADIVTGTVKVVRKITEVVITQIYVCAPEPVKIVFNPFGLIEWKKVTLPKIVNGAINGATGTKASDVVTKLNPEVLGSIKCIMKGKWMITQLKHLNLDIPLIKEAPFGLKVCVDNQCALKLKEALIGDLVGGLPFTLFKLLLEEGEAEKLFDELGLNNELQEIITLAVNVGVWPAGFTVAAFAKLVLAAILLILYHATIIVGQIAFYESSGQLGNGVCLHHPTVPLVAVTMIGVQTVFLAPPAFAALIHFPVIVTPS